MLRDVPPSFVAGVLLQTVLSPVHYKPSPDFDAEAEFRAFLSSYVSCLAPDAQLQLFSRFAEVISVKGLPRVGFQATLHCFAAASAHVTSPSAAAGVPVAVEHGSTPTPAGSTDAPLWRLQLLSSFRTMISNMQCYPGRAYKVKCFKALLQLAANLAPFTSEAGRAAVGSRPADETDACALAAAVAGLLCDLPPQMVSPGGDLHQEAKAWLIGEHDTSGSAADSKAGGAAASHLIVQLFDYFYQGGGSGSSGGAAESGSRRLQAVTSHEMALWASQAEQVARLLLIAGDCCSSAVCSITHVVRQTEISLNSRAFLL